MSKILIIDPSKTTFIALQHKFGKANKLYQSSNAEQALEIANKTNSGPDIVIIELSLAGHSGMEFLYEFRTYRDWKNIPVILYSNVRLDSSVLNSKTWTQLNIYKYIYKPESSVASLVNTAEKALSD